MIISLDPGLNGIGWAAYGFGGHGTVSLPENQRLLHCGYAAAGKPAAPGGLAARWVSATYALVVAVRPLGPIELAVCEHPRSYPREKSEVDPNVLIDLAGVVGAALVTLARETGCGVEIVHPHTWKASLPHEIVAKRLREKLSPEEARVLEAGLPKGRGGKVLKGLAHNCEDAVGIGLAHFGRFRT